MRSKRQCSMCPAIHTKSRSWLRSSSTHEPSDPPLRAVFRGFGCTRQATAAVPPGGSWDLPPVVLNWLRMKVRKKKKLGRGGDCVVRRRSLNLAERLRKVPRPGCCVSEGVPSAPPADPGPPRSPGTIGDGGTPAAGSRAARGRSREPTNSGTKRNPREGVSVMILPQVHLRKPCYDFYFL